MLFLSFFPPYASLFCRNAPCPPASWVDSGSVHPWHRVWVSHAAVPGADWVCCQWEQHSCGPSGGGESGRPSQCDGFGSGKTQDKLIADDSLCIDTHQAVKSSILSVCDHLAVLLSSVSSEGENWWPFWQWPVCRRASAETLHITGCVLAGRAGHAGKCGWGVSHAFWYF